MAVFDRYSSEYELAVGQAIAFAGQPHDAYVEAKARKLLALVRRRLGAEPASALDVGCGVGLMDRHLVGRVRSLHGVDASQAMIERAERALPAVDYRVSDGAPLPYEDGRFDVTFAVCVLHHVEPGGRSPLLAEMGRVTRPGGLVVVFEHNPANPLTRKVVRSCSFDEGVQLLGRRETSRRLGAAGLDVTDADYILFFPWRLRLLEALEQRLARVPAGAQYVVAARKQT
jgi:ubiquinone/menaquinone biosynthesis C-methylase UbiE